MLSAIDRETENRLFDEIERSEFERHLDAFEGLRRYPGTDDERRASEYVVETLSEYGVDATLHTHEGYVSVPESATVTVTTPTRKELGDAITVAFSASTPPDGTTGAVVAVEDASDIGGDAAGEILLLPEGNPNSGRVRAAEEAGARAVICQSPNEHVYEGIVSPVWGAPTPDDVDDLPSLPVAEVPHAAGEWLRDRLRRGPVEATVNTQVTTETRTLPCPVGRIEGRSDRYLLVGNHVDSWHEGITDNATAMAATLEIARILADRDLERGVVFGFWAAHSTGRYAGSTWYADEHWMDLRENGVAYLHLDLNGLKGADSLWYQHMAELEAEHLDAMDVATDLAIGETSEGYLGATGRPARNSDQSFWGAGLTSLLSGARLPPESEEGGPLGGGWWWHTPEDTRDKVDLDVLVEETKLYLALTARLCASPVLPHDYRATVDDFETVLDEIEESADEAFDFEGPRGRLTRLDALLDEVYTEVDARVPADDALSRAFEDLQVRLGNVLNPALYLGGEEYEQEAALPGYARLPYLRAAESLPGSTGRDRQFTLTALRRGTNKLEHRLATAIRHTEQFRERWL
ncbi:MAG: M28 family peptidase [Halobacteriaceae archaeon]